MLSIIAVCKEPVAVNTRGGFALRSLLAHLT
jgi:hypothetical protein